jgi:indolepyruvate ferredoxin oxidoreductase, beta subunit
MDAQLDKTRPISIAICALGGEGGGVLADWIVDLAQHGGYLAQTTSVPGVAQRTGATVYYVELFPKAAAQAAGREPVLALMPVPGDVDIVLASELMEAGRAVQRGFVTPERTTLVASTHRVFAMTEKIALADGRADDAALLAAARGGARRFIGFDMEAIADAARSLVSAVLFGALAGSGALPFQRPAFEAAIRRGGVGVAGSLAAFSAGFEAAASGKVTTPADPGPSAPQVPDGELRAEIERGFPAAVRDIVMAGVARLVDYQDADYARDYLARLVRFRDIEQRQGHGAARLLAETARQLALAMSYEDTVRVADLKIRSDRFARVRTEVELEDSQILEIAEYFHPRTQEIADTLPAPLGRGLLRTGWARRAADRVTRKGRVVKTTSIGGFLLLYLLSRLKPLRRRSLRFGAERAAIDGWLDAVAATAASDYQLAVEVARARTLVKGYGDTHARGRAKFETLIGALPRVSREGDPAAAFRGLIAAALADEAGDALEQAIRSLPTEPGSAMVA